MFLSRCEVEKRITQLATSVVNEILSVDEAVEAQGSVSGSQSSEPSDTDSEHSEQSLDRKMSWLAHALITETAKRKQREEGTYSGKVLV